jgi:hypothetical protein
VPAFPSRRLIPPACPFRIAGSPKPKAGSNAQLNKFANQFRQAPPLRTFCKPVPFQDVRRGLPASAPTACSFMEDCAAYAAYARTPDPLSNPDSHPDGIRLFFSKPFIAGQMRTMPIRLQRLHTASHPRSTSSAKNKRSLRIENATALFRSSHREQ